MRYLSEATVREAVTEQVEAVDDYLGGIRLGLGLGLHSEAFPAPSPTSVHWGGYGGSWGLMDPRAGVSLGYAPNQMFADTAEMLTNEPRLERFNRALADILPRL